MHPLLIFNMVGDIVSARISRFSLRRWRFLDVRVKRHAAVCVWFRLHLPVNALAVSPCPAHRGCCCLSFAFAPFVGRSDSLDSGLEPGANADIPAVHQFVNLKAQRILILYLFSSHLQPLQLYTYPLYTFSPFILTDTNSPFHLFFELNACYTSFAHLHHLHLSPPNPNPNLLQLHFTHVHFTPVLYTCCIYNCYLPLSPYNPLHLPPSPRFFLYTHCL